MKKINFIKNHWVVDIEASSFSEKSYPIEIGIVGLNSEVKLERLIKPCPVWNDWSDGAQKIHGISRSDLSQGAGVKSVAMEVNELLAGGVLIIECDIFDRFWLFKLFEFARIKPKFEIVSFLEFSYDNKINIDFECYKKMKSGADLKHRALSDAIFIRNTLKFASE